MELADNKEILIRLKRSLIGVSPNQRKTARALGLRKLGSSRLHTINPVIRGMMKKIEHLIQVDATEK